MYTEMPTEQVTSAAAGGFCCSGGEALACVVAPGAGGIKLQISLPVFARFVEGAQLFANQREVVARVGMTRIEAHGQAKMLARLFELADFFQHATQIEVCQPALGIAFNGAAIAAGSLFEISLFVVERSAIDQGVGAPRILPQSVLVGVDRFRPGFAVCAVGFVIERQSEPLIGAALGNDLNFLV